MTDFVTGSVIDFGLPVTTRVHLVRHGEVFNPEKVLYGRLPGFRLSENGERQAKVTAEYLAGADVAAVVASPLDRAQQTAAPIAAAHSLDVRTDHRLIESRNAFEGKPFEAGPAVFRYPKLWKLLANPLRPSWGEPYAEIAERMLAAVHFWRDAYPGREVVLVSHQLPVWTTRRAMEGRKLWHRPDRRQCGLASITTAVYAGTTLARVGLRRTERPHGERPRLRRRLTRPPHPEGALWRRNCLVEPLRAPRGAIPSTEPLSGILARHDRRRGRAVAVPGVPGADQPRRCRRPVRQRAQLRRGAAGISRTCGWAGPGVSSGTPPRWWRPGSVF